MSHMITKNSPESIIWSQKIHQNINHTIDKKKRKKEKKKECRI